MAQAWPGTLQQLLNQANFDVSFADTTLKSDMGVGAPKRRRRYTKGIKNMTCSIWVTSAQYTILENFYDTTLNGGVDSFEFLHPITKVLSLYKFSGPPKVSYVGGDTYNVTMGWEMQP